MLLLLAPMRLTWRSLNSLTPPPLPPLPAPALTPPFEQVFIHEFESWASVQAEKALQFDWDDALGNAARRERGLRLEKMRMVRLGLLLPATAACPLPARCLPRTRALSRPPPHPLPCLQAEMKRRRGEAKGDRKANAKAVRMPGQKTTSFE